MTKGDINMKTKKPVIKVFVIRAAECFLKEVLAGIEEEGILYEVETIEYGSSKELATIAATESLLETGVGIDEELVSITICKLSLIHISEPTRRTPISYAVFCLK